MTSESREEATLDFNQLKSCLSSLKDSIKVEQQKAQRDIFRSFMGEVLRLDDSDEGFIDLENQYIQQLNLLSLTNLVSKIRNSINYMKKLLLLLMRKRDLNYAYRLTK